ncbi:MAG: beta-lactamase family protein, partial [Xanthomonadales bacterium]|nr:beta-lactamase family protein [Xanthomonadales bacterium]
MNRFAHGVAAPPQRGVLRRSLGSVLVLALAGGAQLATAGPCNQVSYNPDLVEQASPGIHTSTFVDEVVLGMADSQVKGYVATLTNARGEIVVEIEQGQARTLCDPGGQRAFDVGTQTPWGSVSKLITTAAAIKVARQFNVDLDDPIVNHLPYRWRSQLHPRFANGESGSGPVTLRMMLQHRGGFRHSSCGGRTIKQRLLDGDAANCAAANQPPTAAPPTVGSRSYANMSQGLFQIMLAYMAAPVTMQVFESQAAGYNTADYDAFIQMATNNSYRGLVNTQLYAPIGISGSCNMAEISTAQPNGNYIRWYDDASDSSGTLPHDQNHTCAAGAWILSSAQMRKLLFQLKHTENLLLREDYALMEAGYSDSLGWWKSDWDIGRSWSHNGQWSGTRAEVRSLPGGYIATLVMNSANFADSAGGVLDDAFRDARVKGLAHA